MTFSHLVGAFFILLSLSCVSAGVIGDESYDLPVYDLTDHPRSIPSPHIPNYTKRQEIETYDTKEGGGDVRFKHYTAPQLYRRLGLLPRKRQILFRQCFWNPIACF